MFLSTWDRMNEPILLSLNSFPKKASGNTHVTVSEVRGN